MGIYEIVHLETGSRYIGSSKDVARRMRGHRNSLEHGKHHAIKLQSLVDRDGIDAFRFQLIQRVDDWRMLRQAERDAIREVPSSQLLNTNLHPSDLKQDPAGVWHRNEIPAGSGSLLTLRQHRMSQGLTIRALSDISSVSGRTIVAIENRQYARVKTFTKLAIALKISEEDIREYGQRKRAHGTKP